MGGCVSFNYTEIYPSQLHEIDHAMPNLLSRNNREDDEVASKRQVEIPFSSTRMLTEGSNECASTSVGTNGAHAMVYEFLLGGVDMVFCGLFDGHGPNGDLMSEKVRDNLPSKLLSVWRSLLTGENTTLHHEDSTESNVDLDVAEKLPEAFIHLQHSYLDAFNMMDRDLKENVESYCSGSTAVTIVKKGRDLLIGNLGKSRAILGTRDTNNNIIGEQLSIDLKPNVGTELDRIRRSGGRVFPTIDEPNICKLFLPGKDAPGLAVSRGFGDFCMKDYGLIADPQVSYRRLARSDKFLILGTHGLWDVLSNEYAVNIVACAPNKKFAAEVLVYHAVHLWRLKDPTRKTDDISAVVLYMDIEDEDPEEDPKLIYYEVPVAHVDEVSPPIEFHENIINNDESNDESSRMWSNEDELSAQKTPNQEGSKKKKKKGKSLIRIRVPKFIKKWGRKVKDVEESNGDS